MAKDDISSIAGLPDELGIDEDLAKSEQRVRIRVESRRYGKPVTIVSGFDPDGVDLKEIASTLKRKLATGGTVEDDAIELQGNHLNRLPEILRDEGYAVDE